MTQDGTRPCAHGCHRRGQHAPDCPGDCHGCLPRIATPGLHVCATCCRRVHDDLTALPDLHADLLEPSSSGGRVGPRSAERPEPLPSPRRQARERIKGTLVSWCQVLADDYRLTLPADTVHAIARHVTVQADRLLASEHADQLVHDVTGMASEARSLVSAGRTRGVRVPCVGTTDTGPCDNRVTVTEPDPDGIVTCRACGEWGTQQWWIDRASPDVAEQMTARAASDHLLTHAGLLVEPGLIRVWVQRGKLTAVGRDAQGRPLYDRVAVVALAQAQAHRLRTA